MEKLLTANGLEYNGEQSFEGKIFDSNSDEETF